MSSATEQQRTSGPKKGRNELEAVDVLVLGASFAGIEFVYQLNRHAAGRALNTVVIDRQSEHGYIPLVHERLCRRLPPEATELPTARYIESLPNARFVQDEVVELAGRVVTLESGQQLSARFVVIALGSVLAPPPAISGADQLLCHKSAAEYAHASARLDATLAGEGGEPRVVVVGGGISGVELAGELAFLSKRGVSGWRAPRVTVVEAGPRLTPSLCQRASAAAERHLRGQGVEVLLETRLRGVTEGSIEVTKDDELRSLECALAFWTGGVRPAPILGRLALPLTDAGWLSVGPTLQCFPTPRPTEPEVFACGDAVRVIGGDGEWPTMQRAIECIWQGKVVARNVLELAAHKDGFPDGVPPLRPHELRSDFAFGVSLGAKSLIVYGRVVLDAPRANTWFRRWLMRRYFARYRPTAVEEPEGSPERPPAHL